MKVKCYSREFDCKPGDYILDNGACYQIITKTYNEGYHNLHPKLAKTTFKKLLKQGYIKLSKKKYKTQYSEMDIYEFTEKSDG